MGFFREWRMRRLRGKLRSGAQTARVEPAAKLFRMGDESVRDMLLEALDDEDTFITAFLPFMDLGRVLEIIPRIKELLLTTERSLLALVVVMCLGDCGEPEAIEAIASLVLARTSDAFRYEALENPLIPGYTPVETEGADVIGMAVAVLGKKGDASVIPALERAAEDPDESVRDDAADAFRELRKRGVIRED